jgi:uncharacterized lipoprotein YajG
MFTHARSTVLYGSIAALSMFAACQDQPTSPQRTAPAATARRDDASRSQVRMQHPEMHIP